MLRPSQRRILLTGLATEFLVTLVPQWTRIELVPAGPAGSVLAVTQSAGFHLLFMPPTTGISQGIDLGRLGLTWLLVALAAGFAFVWTLRPERSTTGSA